MGSTDDKTNPRVLGATNKQLEDRVKALETWRVAIAIDAFKTATTNSLATLASRVSALEAGGGSDTSALEARLVALENKLCVQLDAADPQTFESRLKVLELDHIPD